MGSKRSTMARDSLAACIGFASSCKQAFVEDISINRSSAHMSRKQNNKP
jgi:hypothetical protein